MTSIGQGIHITVNDTARFEGYGTTAGVGFGTNGVGYGVGLSDIDGNIITKKEIDFTADKSIDDVPEKKFKTMFRDLDLDKNGKLSQSEIDAYKNYLKLRDENCKKHQRYDDASSNAALPTITGIVSGLIGGVVGAVISNKGLSMLMEYLSPTKIYGASCNDLFPGIIAKTKQYVFENGDLLVGTTPLKNKMLKAIQHAEYDTPKNSLIALGGVALGLLAGYGAYKYVSNLSSTKNNKCEAEQLRKELERDDAEIKKLDEQYKHIGYQFVS